MSEPYRQPAGWYPQGTVYRYWDGTAWTEHTAPITQPAPPESGSGTRYSPVPPAPSGPYDAMPAPRYQPYPPPPMVHAPYGMMPPVGVAPKSPGLSLLAAFFIPGLGSMINGDVAKGVGILVGWVLSCILTLILIGLVGVVAFWVWGMVDAYQGAQRWNARYGILS